MFADILIDYNKPAIRNTRLGIVYTNFDIAADNAISGDTFELGTYSDTDGFKKTDDDNAILNWLENPIRQEIQTTLNNYPVIDKWIFDNPTKQIKLEWKFNHILGRFGYPADYTKTKQAVKK